MSGQLNRREGGLDLHRVAHLEIIYRGRSLIFVMQKFEFL